MSKAQLKEPSQSFLRLLKLSIVSFISMGILIGYHGAPLINSLIGVFWLIFAVAAGMVVKIALTSTNFRFQKKKLAIESQVDDEEPVLRRSQRRRTKRAEKQTASEHALNFPASS